MLRKGINLLGSKWSQMTQFSGDSYLQSMMGHGLKASSQSELVDKLVNRGFLIVDRPEFVEKVKTVDRAKFVANCDNPYSNNPVSLANGHCMSTPQFHAQVLSLLAKNLGPGRVAAELGAGSGYLPAVMASVGCDKVFAVEQDPKLFVQARENLKSFPAVVVTDAFPENTKIDALYISPFFPSIDALMAMIDTWTLAEDAVVVSAVQDHPEAMDQVLVILERETNSWKRTDLFRVMCEPIVAANS